MLHLILKSSTACNSNCLYCDARCRGGTGDSMSLGIVERVLARAAEYLVAHPDEAVECLWHGGEPLLLGPTYYDRVWELHQALDPATGARIRHSVQTNLTCFGGEFVPVFRRLGIEAVGTSYDPEPHVRGGGPDRDSQTYNRRFMHALAVLERHGISWGLTYVVARHSLADPLPVFHFLTNLAAGRSLSLNPVLTQDGVYHDSAITPEEYVQFLGALFPYWLTHRGRFPGVEPFASLMQGVDTHALGPDALAFGVCDTRRDRLTIGPDGSAHPGGWIDGSRERTFGTIGEMAFDEVFASPGYQAMLNDIVRLQAEACGACRLAWACRGTAEAFVVPGAWCRARVGFVERVLEPLLGRRVDHAE